MQNQYVFIHFVSSRISSNRDSSQATNTFIALCYLQESCLMSLSAITSANAFIAHSLLKLQYQPQFVLHSVPVNGHSTFTSLLDSFMGHPQYGSDWCFNPLIESIGAFLFWWLIYIVNRPCVQVFYIFSPII